MTDHLRAQRGNASASTHEGGTEPRDRSSLFALLTGCLTAPLSGLRASAAGRMRPSPAQRMGSPDSVVQMTRESCCTGA
eukprot:scaffold2621_cov64-Phaeocystis_antarctica.AAC.6